MQMKRQHIFIFPVNSSFAGSEVSSFLVLAFLLRISARSLTCVLDAVSFIVSDQRHRFDRLLSSLVKRPAKSYTFLKLDFRYRA